ncbi:MAG TPA: hypothetical protein VNY07_02220 [Chthoniobacterales bacterium]|nr:hypothetical protein [Chthoniobacterales bacterium]
MKTNLLRKQSGSTLIVAMSITATLMVIAGIAAEYTMNISRNVQRSNTLESAIVTGDSCLDILFGNWRSICGQPGNVNLPLPTNSFTSIPLPTSSLFPNIPNFGAEAADYYGASLANPPAISNFKVVAVDAEWNPIADPAATPIPMLGAAGTTTTAVYNYVASADITLPTATGNVVAKVRRVFQRQQISPWNFAIFYVDPLEIHPGPQFTLTGWVHTNSNLYTAHSSLTFASKVDYGSDWFINFMPGDGQHPGETPQSPNYPSNLPPARAQALQPFGLDSTSIFNTTDSNPNNDSWNELIQPPVAGFPDPLAGERYWDQANVVIQVSDNPSSSTKGFDGVKGHDLVTIGTPNPDGTITPLLSTSPLYQTLSSAISTNQTIQDNREGATIRIATLDVSQIENTAPGNPTYKAGVPASPIIYMYDNSNSSSTRRAIRIKNGSKIPTAGLTIASNNPVYVQGDFNTGETPPSDSGNPSDATTPQVSGYTRAPASILADAMNILSNSWSDSQSGTMPAATNTTVNAAFIAGIVPTAPVGGDGSYSGGAENFVRFLEDWSSATLTYYGSMVELYQSKQSIGEWGKANVYSPPKRQWYFDTNFQTKLPPGSIMIYTYIKGRWYVL